MIVLLQIQNPPKDKHSLSQDKEMKSGNKKPAPISVGSHKNKVLLEPRQVGVNDTHFIGSDPI